MEHSIRAVIFDWAGTTVDYGCFAPVKGFIDGYKSIGLDITLEMARKPMGLLKMDHTREIAKMLSVPVSEEQILEVYNKFEEILFGNIKDHCDIKDYVLETVDTLRKQGISIGSTTGYTSMMMEKVLPLAKKQGYSPDYCITPDQVTKGRPYPYMIWKNIMEFGIMNTRSVIKVGDTVADIEEGKNANCWTVGVITGSSELGLSREEVSQLDRNDLYKKKAKVRDTYTRAGADFIIDDMNELLPVVDEINTRLM